MESIEIVEEIIKDINSFNPYRVGDVIIAVLILASLFALALKAMYISSIEELFMNKKQKIMREFFVIIFFSIVFTIYNLIFLIFPWLLLVDFVLFLVCSLRFFYCFWQSMRKSVGANKEEIDYNEKCNKWVVYTIICMMPCLAVIIKIESEKLPLINYALIAGVIGVILIYFSMPSLLIKRSSNYFMSDGQKIYIYKRIDGGSVLCGNDPTINKSEKYIIITYDELKKKEIFHIKNVDFDKSEDFENETLVQRIKKRIFKSFRREKE